MNLEIFLSRVKARFSETRQLIPHSCVTGANLHADCNPEFGISDNIESLYEGHDSYPFTVSLPIPMGSPTTLDRSVVNGMDPAFDIVLETISYESKLMAFLQKMGPYNTEDLERRLLETTPEEPCVKLPPNVVSLAQIISQKPDPNFSGDYNFYYGGTLTLCDFQTKAVVIYPESCSSGTLNVMIPKFENGLCLQDQVHRVSHTMNETSPIYQVQSCENLLLLRQKKRIGIFQLNYNDTFSLAELNSVSAEESFVNSSMNKFRKEEFAVLTPKSKVEIFDVSTNSSPKSTLNLDFLEDSSHVWGSVHYHDENNLMFCDRNSIYVFDTRRPANSSALSWNVVSCTEPCSQIYASVKGSSLHYVSTTHNLLALDVRRGWVQRWTHMLTHTPTLLSVMSEGTSDDSLLLGSQTSGDVVHIYNMHSESFDFQYVKTPPYRLPSLTETLHQAALSERCSSPLARPRFFLSVTGLACLRTSNNVDIFLCNSVGDVFTQRMNLAEKASNPFTTRLNDSESKRLSEWQQECLDQLLNSKLSINTTKVHRSHGLQNVFDNRSSSTPSKDIESPSQNRASVIQPWMWSKQRLKSCCDFLASDLLSVWDLKDDESCDIAIESEEVDLADDPVSSDSSEEIDINERVQKWMAESTLPADSESSENLSK